MKILLLHWQLEVDRRVSLLITFLVGTFIITLLTYLILRVTLKLWRKKIPVQGGERRLYKVNDRLYFYRGYFSNSVVLIFPTCVVVVDTQTSTWGGQHLRKCIEQVTKKTIRWVINTHYHGDHVGGNSAFSDAEIVMSKRSAEMLVERDSERLQYAEVFGLLIQEQPGISRVDRVFDKSLTLHIDGDELHILHCGKIETDDACVIWWPRQRILACGDGVTTSGYPFLGVPFLDEGLRYDGEWIGFLQKLIDLQPCFLLPGHGPLIEGQNKITARLRLLQNLLSDLLNCTKKYMQPHLPNLQKKWQDGTLNRGDVPREIVDAVFEKLTAEIGHYSQNPQLEEHVSCQRFAYYRALNSLIEERAGRGWWEDIRPSIHPKLAITSQHYQSLDYEKVCAYAESALARKDLKTALEYTEAYRIEHPQDATILALQADIYLRGTDFLTSRIDGSEYFKCATDKARQSLAIDPSQPLALVSLATCMVFSDLIIGQPSDKAIAMLTQALDSQACNSSQLTGRQTRKARLVLGKAYQYNFQDQLADKYFRLVLPFLLRPIYPMFKPLMWTLK
jgi:cyclase